MSSIFIKEEDARFLYAAESIKRKDKRVEEFSVPIIKYALYLFVRERTYKQMHQLEDNFLTSQTWRAFIEEAKKEKEQRPTIIRELPEPDDKGYIHLGNYDIIHVDTLIRSIKEYKSSYNDDELPLE